MAKKDIRKIIYFDKETIRNILQEQHHGEYTKTTDVVRSAQNDGSLEVSSEIKLDVPFISRLAFLFNGKLNASYVIKKDSTTTISSTEISEFEKIKPQLISIEGIQLHDIENSSTSLRVAGCYLRIVKGGIEGMDTKEFKTVMDSYDGYDTYCIDPRRYVRFNNSAFVSNYKRNDLLTTTMSLYCIKVGEFERDRFDFIKEISKMENLISTADKGQTLADAFPSSLLHKKTDNESEPDNTKKDLVKLYDVIYACVTTEAAHDK